MDGVRSIEVGGEWRTVRLKKWTTKDDVEMYLTGHDDSLVIDIGNHYTYLISVLFIIWHFYDAVMTLNRRGKEMYIRNIDILAYTTIR